MSDPSTLTLFARTNAKNKASSDKLANWETFEFSSHPQNTLQALEGGKIEEGREAKIRSLALLSLSVGEGGL